MDIEGMYVLLDLAETCEMSLRRICLSSVCTILENPKSFQFFVEWSSSKTTINASQLLIKLYQEEDKRYGVQKEGGILCSSERPLNPNDSYYKRKQVAQENDRSIAGSRTEGELNGTSQNGG